MVDQRPVRLVPHRRNQRDLRGRSRPDHDLVVEAPKILEASAAARDDQHVGARNRPALFERVEPADRRCNLFARALALHLDRPEEHVNREAVGDAVQNVSDDGPGRGGDDADDMRQEGQRPLSARVEQAFGRELAAALLEQGHQRTGSGRFQRLDNNLVLR